MRHCHCVCIHSFIWWFCTINTHFACYKQIKKRLQGLIWDALLASVSEKLEAVLPFVLCYSMNKSASIRVFGLFHIRKIDPKKYFSRWVLVYLVKTATHATMYRLPWMTKWVNISCCISSIYATYICSCRATLLTEPQSSMETTTGGEIHFYFSPPGGITEPNVDP